MNKLLVHAGCGEMARFCDEDVRMALNICAARAGYSLCPLQEQVIISFVQGSDVFVGIPTGSGKSLLQHSSQRFQLAAESKVVHCHYSKSPNRTDERPGTVTLCAYVYTRMQLIGAKIPLYIPSDFKNLASLARPFFLPRACVEKTAGSRD